MNRFASLKSFAAAAMVLGTLAAATTAQAQSDVQFSIALGSSGVYVQPAPHYAYPRHVYEQPTPVYVYPRTVYVQPTPVHGWRHQRRNQHDHHVNVQGPWGDYDYDRDGIPNRYDRFPRNPNRS